MQLVLVFSRVLRDSMTRYVGRSVGRSVGPSALAFFGVYGRFLRYCSCPPARDFGSRVYGLVSCGHETLKEALSVSWSIRQSVRPSVGPSISTSQKVGRRAFLNTLSVCEGVGVWMRVGRPCPPVCNNIETHVT